MLLYISMHVFKLLYQNFVKQLYNMIISRYFQLRVNELNTDQA